MLRAPVAAHNRMLARMHDGPISVRAVTKSFPVRSGALAALGPVDLDIAAGTTVTLFGPSGCGKTTLLRIIAGLERPTTGDVRVGGATPAAARAAKRFGFVPQSPALLPWRTVEANARLLQDVNRRANPAGLPDPVALLAQVGLTQFRDAYPAALSGGMQQRVGLVRAFALGAPYLLMDEPFAALDELTRAEMRHLLAGLRTGGTAGAAPTVVFVTHSLAEAVFLSDRVIVMSARPGRVVGDVAIGLPRPRTPELEDDPAFFAYETELRRLLTHGAREGIAS
jgi:NitT/TauT family transport system ATP-binding protein